MNKPSDDTPARARRKYQRNDRVIAHYAVIRGAKSQESAHQMELRVRSHARTLMYCYRLHAPDRGVRWLADLQAELYPEQHELTDSLVHRVASVDRLEDGRREEWLMTRCRARLIRWEQAMVRAYEGCQRILPAIRTALRGTDTHQRA